MGSERGGPVDGERSISGRACLPLLIAMIMLAAVVVAAIGSVAVAVMT